MTHIETPFEHPDGVPIATKERWYDLADASVWQWSTAARNDARAALEAWRWAYWPTPIEALMMLARYTAVAYPDTQDPTRRRLEDWIRQKALV